MDWILICKALVLGVVEGLTEFLPVSSTGHLIIAGSVLNFSGEFAKTFDVVIQLGAIFAVCWEFRRKIGRVVAGLPTRPDARRFALNVIVATVPAIVLALLFERAIKSVLFAPVPVAFALVAGGVIILWVESRRRTGQASGDARLAQTARVQSIDDITVVDALKVGFAQCFALIPGMSRSGSTIIGAMLFGLERRVATEFSFFLAIPVIFGATVYELHKAWHTLSTDWLGIFGVGFVAAFVSAFACVRWLLRYVASHDFVPFAWYRIAFGLVILLFGYGGGLGWDIPT
ncbi:undecaprenyl-diphosphate phosphatase [Paraburkholderia caballeronis]|uniref:Undecaprenyl-diphosphatase n=1 Tax=Paraburkholderia caballeronis TaxID=416943 RepID=A0A1H7TK98_9BURK|nr:undecaprenyl-diphosphate phosphatase [Paraburkholderia caballeronis]PXW18422.1 undecaprenyl-diphosphatase [Paraburkholderia caballeronis]PXW95702.1 undecaprenyl-diphosphatase [Paraburkholderia caballeronis]RAJ92048.1 undecaprenyl-diphosphatase [Paraburkholderia caballeronis]SEB76705.1 Undecaprenyl-diphosphatase [Paraburkholderia caballeronis]SEL84985.1 Undecaprenyl-diphosphatase [Paraburkholderia caballeronis]